MSLATVNVQHSSENTICSFRLERSTNAHKADMDVAGMLLIDTDQTQITSLRATQLRSPFVPVSRLRTPEDARAFLWRFMRSGAGLRRALAAEMAHEGWSVPSPAMNDIDLVTAAAREIAAWRLQVAVLLPGNPMIRFDPCSNGGSLDDAAFVNETVAAAFLAALRTDRQATSAIDEAFAHRTTSPRAGTDRISQATPKPSGVTWIPEEVARLLATGALLLLPLDSARRAFRLIWRQRSWQANSSNATSAGSARPQPPRSRPSHQPPILVPLPPPATRSILPKPPSSSSPQADALIAAAARGVPFCEECARAAGQ
jgi:hypothetical protein